MSELLLSSATLLVRTCAAFASTVVIGLVLLRVTKVDVLFSTSERLVMAFVGGNAAIAVELLVLATLNIPWTASSVGLPWIALAGLSLILRRRGARPIAPSMPPRPHRLVLLHYVAASGILFLLLINVTNPFLTADARAFWTPKAKVFYVHRENPRAAFAGLWSFFHQDYPLLVPLDEAWVFLWQGGLHEPFMKLLFPAYTVCLFAAVVAFTTRLEGASAGGIAGALLMTTPDVITQGSTAYVDLPLALFFWIATSLGVSSIRTPDARVAALSGMFAGFAIWVKNEGEALALLLAGILTLHAIFGERTRDRMRAIAILWVSAVLVASIWLAVRHTLRAESYLRIPGVSEWPSVMAARLPTIGHDAAAGLFSVDTVLHKWNVIWYALPALLLLRWRRVTTSVAVALAIAGGYCVVIALVSLVTPFDVHWYFVESFDRLLLHVYPLVVFAVASLLVTPVE